MLLLTLHELVLHGRMNAPQACNSMHMQQRPKKRRRCCHGLNLGQILSYVLPQALCLLFHLCDYPRQPIATCQSKKQQKAPHPDMVPLLPLSARLAPFTLLVAPRVHSVVAWRHQVDGSRHIVFGEKVPAMVAEHIAYCDRLVEGFFI